MAMFLMSLTSFSDYYGAFDRTDHEIEAKVFQFKLSIIFIINYTPRVETALRQIGIGLVWRCFALCDHVQIYILVDIVIYNTPLGISMVRIS